MSLRRRLVLGCLAVAAVLLVADFALVSTFRSFLLGRVDRQLATAVGPLTGPRGPAFPPGVGGRRQDQTSPEESGDSTFTEYFLGRADASGTLRVRYDRFGVRDRPAPRPDPEQVVSHAVFANEPIRPFTATSAGGEQWRLAALWSRGGILVVGVHLGEFTATYHRVLFVLLSATAAVLATLLAVAWWVLRQGVRPLAAMTATAGAIAAGDLSERVEHADERTEAGRLGAALNTMMGKIEQAFAERAAAERRLRRFVADASHELRTPLTSIRGYAELYRQGALSDPQRLADAMRRVEGEALRMGALVDDLLLLARLDQGRPLERAPVSLDRIAADAVADARATDPSRPIELDVQPAVVPGDESRLRQVVGNLVGNALRHTPAGTPVAVSVSAAGGSARLEVADRGPGMDPETASRIFERFYRADPSRASHSGGAGLGLSIVEAVVAAHGGRVRVETAPGAGARFVVELPSAA